MFTVSQSQPPTPQERDLRNEASREVHPLPFAPTLHLFLVRSSFCGLLSSYLPSECLKALHCLPSLMSFLL